MEGEKEKGGDRVCVGPSAIFGLLLSVLSAGSVFQLPSPSLVSSVPSVVNPPLRPRIPLVNRSRS